jgi:hypothetical protein
MNLTDEQLLEVERLAGLFLSPDEIAVLIGVSAEEFCECIAAKSGIAYQSYFRGKTISKRDIHENIVKMAKHGSPQAEEFARDMMLKQTSAEKRAKK